MRRVYAKAHDDFALMERGYGIRGRDDGVLFFMLEHSEGTETRLKGIEQYNGMGELCVVFATLEN